MTSSVTQIEISEVRDVNSDDATLTVTLADGRTIATPLEWYPRLAYGTPSERADWRLIGDGEGIRWPQLDEDISVEGLVAGRKSGESARSLKDWMTIQEKLRQWPRDFPELRREVLRTGALSGEEIVRRAHATITAYDSDPRQWRMLLCADPFEELRREGMTDDCAVAVYEAASAAAGSQAKDACAAAGVVDAGAKDAEINQQSVFLVLYSKEMK
jgi:hypothetical protein